MYLSPESIKLFLRYSAYSIALFIPEYILFLLLIEYTPFHYVTITIGSFVFGITSQYLVVRHFVFNTTNRHWQSGYMLFFISSCVGAGLVVLSMVLFVEVLNIPREVARVLSAAIAGYLVYLFNLYENFKASSVYAPETQSSDIR